MRYHLDRISGYSPPLARLLIAAAEAVELDQHLLDPDFRDRMLVIARPRAVPIAAR